MTVTTTAKTELVAIGFGDTHTVFLARAALARMLKEDHGMAIDDMAIVLRGTDGNVAVQQTLDRDAGRNDSSTFWDSSADLLFAIESPVGKATEETLEKCAKVGIDPASANLVFNQFQLCKSALLVRTKNLARLEKVIGVLRGFGGELARVPLSVA